MERTQSSIFGWETVGKAIGWIGIGLNVGLGIFCVSLFWLLNGEIYLIFTLVIFFLNLIASYYWLIGIAKKKKWLMLASLIWFSIPLSIWGTFMLFILFEGICRMFEGKKPFVQHDYLVFAITAFCVVAYFAAVLSYRPIQKHFRTNSTETQRLNVSYTVQSRNEELIQKCACEPNCDCCERKDNSRTK
ncbi:uncharacterized protein LOC116348043 [Contarinia nasturtii]|uniref:uncharacterized protein LOC116348043 n=1 Tax=Contarinia nasturtii TaxID=265458 RepID=UPI0012D37BDC|nr:uncharacterized protein LOC116348043 [Contarinia nasturtii]